MRVSGHELPEIRGEVWLGGRLRQPGLNGTCHVVTKGLHVDVEGVVDDNLVHECRARLKKENAGVLASTWSGPALMKQ